MTNITLAVFIIGVFLGTVLGVSIASVFSVKNYNKGFRDGGDWASHVMGQYEEDYYE